MLIRFLFKPLLICCTISLIHCSSYESQKTLESDPSYENRAYKFGYEINDGYNNKQYFKEHADANNVKKGSYGYIDAYGIYRKVEYIADDKGFRVNIKSNEPGLGAQKQLKKLSSLSADDSYLSAQPKYTTTTKKNDYSQTNVYEPQQKEEIYSAPKQTYEPKNEQLKYNQPAVYEPQQKEEIYPAPKQTYEPKYNQQSVYEPQQKQEIYPAPKQTYEPKNEQLKYEPQIKYDEAKSKAFQPNINQYSSNENCDEQKNNLPQTYITPVKSPYTSPIVKSQQISYKPQTHQQPQAHNPYVSEYTHNYKYNIVGMSLNQLRKLPFKMVRSNNIGLPKEVEAEYWEKQNQLVDEAANISESSQTENPALAMPKKRLGVYY